MVAIEEIVRAQAERMEEASKTHERDLGEIFEALVKLGTNQQTLGNNLEAWRFDSSGDISIVSNRLESLERSLQGPRVDPGRTGKQRRTRTQLQAVALRNRPRAAVELARGCGCLAGLAAPRRKNAEAGRAQRSPRLEGSIHFSICCAVPAA